MWTLHWKASRWVETFVNKLMVAGCYRNKLDTLASWGKWQIFFVSVKLLQLTLTAFDKLFKCKTYVTYTTRKIWWTFSVITVLWWSSVSLRLPYPLYLPIFWVWLYWNTNSSVENKFTASAWFNSQPLFLLYIDIGI